MEVPRISKITLNMGVGEAVADKKIMDNAVADLTKITGQKPMVTRARKSVATFKVRDGWRSAPRSRCAARACTSSSTAWSSIAMPRIRDFRGVSARSFDGRGNYNFGVKEQIIFPEIDYDQIDAIRGMDITITTTARDDKAGTRAARSLQLPLPQVERHAMAKTSMVNRETKRTKLVKRYAAKRAKLKEIDPQADEHAGGARGRGRSAAGAAARLEQEPPAQPLRDHGPLARQLSQVRSGPHQAARSHDARRRSGPPQGELVTAGTTGAPTK